MKTALLALALLPSLVLPVAAQDTPWSDFAVGDRVELTFPSGGTIRGTLVTSSPKSTSRDYARESALTLDLTWEYPGLHGTMTVPKTDFKSARKLQPAVKQAGSSSHHPLDRPPGENEKPPGARPVTPANPPGARADAVPDDKPDKDAEELKKALEFYGKYPPPYWGPDRHTMDVQKKDRGQALTPAERDFEAGYPALWEKGRAASPPNPPEPKKE